MIILNVTLLIFILLEASNVLAMYFNPTMKQANAMGVFKAWDKSKNDPEVHNLVRYLTYWVAGSKLIFLFLLIVILLSADYTIKLAAVGALIVSISSFYWKMFPLIKEMDKNKEISPKGYSKKLGTIIAIFIAGFSLAFLIAINI